MGETRETAGLGQALWAWKAYLIVLLTPLLLCPLPIVVGSPEAKCGYVVIVMAVYWVTESLPISVTALVPLIAFPLLGILSSDEVASKYMNDVNMLFTGGLTIAVAVEYWNLHKRIALRVLLLFGVEPKWLMLGMMLATWFLSMWISNTATTAMMMPIMEAILTQLERTDDADRPDESTEKNTVLNGNSKDIPKDTTVELRPTEAGGDGGDETQAAGNKYRVSVDQSARAMKNEEFTRIAKGLSLSVCYAANCGGIASLTGTGPNLVLKSNIDDLYDDIGEPSPVTFGSWMAFGLPLSTAVLLVCWLWLYSAFLWCRGACGKCTGRTSDKGQADRIRKVIQDEYDSLGPMVFGQAMVLFLFILLVILWITRDMGGVAGWGSLFDVKIKDGTAAILIASSLFIVPSTLPWLKSYSNPSHPEDWTKTRSEKSKEAVSTGQLRIRPLLNWPIVHERFPWKLLFLMGGGFAISAGSKESGLSDWVATQLEFFEDWNKWGVLFIFCYITAASTEVTSNTAIATILMPIMIQLALSTGVHPLYYMFPTALACSFAFMLPVATPPNAIVFTYGRVSIPDMMKSGIVLNILAVPILIVITGSIGDAIYNFDDIPAKLLNASSTPGPTLVSI